jgi:hypothetical protein
LYRACAAHCGLARNQEALEKNSPETPVVDSLTG